MYYEVHGSGSPLVLLHGGLLTIDLTFGPILPSLAKCHQVIAVELQGHGHTADIDREMRLGNLAEDVWSPPSSTRLCPRGGDRQMSTRRIVHLSACHVALIDREVPR
jgi:pimeloyl-ACP methyl ester carboxylesterase